MAKKPPIAKDTAETTQSPESGNIRRARTALADGVAAVNRGEREASQEVEVEYEFEWSESDLPLPDPEEFQRDYSTWLAEKKRKGLQLRRHAQAAFKAMDLWPIQARTEEQWVETCMEASHEYHGGQFLLSHLGAEHYLDPKLFATLWMLRNSLAEDTGGPSAAEEMLVDMMVLGYANALRVQGWIGDLALQIEREFFDEHGLHEHYDDGHGGPTSKGLWVEGMLKRFREELLPLLDRCDRMMIRNLKALQALRRGPAPNVSIAAAGQVNVAQQQVNSQAEVRDRRH